MISWERSYHSKCILVGEHTVLRGGLALVVPYTQKYLQIKVSAEKAEHPRLNVQFSGDCAEPWGKLFEEQWDHLLKVTKPNVFFNVHLQGLSHVPLGAGLGGSAILCVAMAELGHQLGWVAREEILALGKKLEERFHGQSSGVDVAAVFAGHALSYHKEHGYQRLPNPDWFELTLHHSGSSAKTSEAVAKVTQLKSLSPNLFYQGEQSMLQGVELGLRAFAEKDVILLKQAFQKGLEAFKLWDLITHPLQNQVQEVLRAGALAAKPTGSGLGGYVVALWPKSQVPHFYKNLRVFAEI